MKELSQEWKDEYIQKLKGCLSLEGYTALANTIAINFYQFEPGKDEVVIIINAKVSISSQRCLSMLQVERNRRDIIDDHTTQLANQIIELFGELADDRYHMGQKRITVLERALFLIDMLCTVNNGGKGRGSYMEEAISQAEKELN